MTPSNSNELVVLTTVPTEAEAAMIVANLEARGIDAEPFGALTSGFRVEIPGPVGVMVRAADLEQAQAALDEIGTDRDPLPET